MATILIVDPKPSQRRTYTTLLGNFGYQLLEAEDGPQALELARTELPDLIIIDMFLPDLDGFTFVHRLHLDPLLTNIPVIFQTDQYDRSELHWQAHDNGIRHLLRIPSEPQEVLRAVNEALNQADDTPRLPKTGQLSQADLELLVTKLQQKVVELEKANERLRSLSLNDGLTGLSNRRGFMILATGLLKFARRAGYSASLIYIDLDSLKYINNTFGHAVGDVTILQFAHILTEIFRESDVVGRMGGDEFVILMIDATEADLQDMQARLQNRVDVYNAQAQPGQELSFSLGAIHVQRDSTITMEALMTQADAAMYKHKQQRRSSSPPQSP